MQEIVKELGFENEEEFNKMVSSLDLSTDEKVKAFKKWQYNDGTKKGLLELNTKIPNVIESKFESHKKWDQDLKVYKFEEGEKVEIRFLDKNPNDEFHYNENKILIAVVGKCGSGKSYIMRLIEEALIEQGLNVNINNNGDITEEVFKNLKGKFKANVLIHERQIIHE